MKNSFVQQFSQNIKFKYSCFDRVILRGYIRWLFFPGGVVKFLRAMGFRKLSNGVMRILTDQFNAHMMNLFFKFDKGKYSTCSKYLLHEWYLSQVEISSNVVFRSARFCTSLFERILDKFQRPRLQHLSRKQCGQVGLPESIAQIFSRRPPSGDHIQDLLETLRQ